MKIRHLFSVVGPFALAIAPLFVAASTRMIDTAPPAPTWPSGVVALTDADGELGGVRVLDPVDLELWRIPVDLVVQPPDHGDVRLETLFATGKLEEIRTGLERALALQLPFLLVTDLAGTPTQENLGEHLEDARAQLADLTPTRLDTHRIVRPDGTYSVLLGEGASLEDPIATIDLARVSVRILFTQGQRAESATVSAALTRAGFGSVKRALTDEPLPDGATVQYRLDAVLGEVVAGAIGLDSILEIADDVPRMRGADVIVLLG